MQTEVQWYHGFDRISQDVLRLRSRAVSQRRTLLAFPEVSLRTPGFMFLALQQVPDADAPVRGSLSILQLILDASLVSKTALAVLLVFSVVSWGIILS